LGASYYFIPANIYLAPAIMTTTLSYTDEALEVNTSDSGGGFQLAVGKEWRIGEQWGLGVAAIYTQLRWDKPDKYAEAVKNKFGREVSQVNASMFTIALSVTFN
jgi:hypothetical protein